MLGFLTAGAIVVTMAGSYAVWDQLSTKQTATLTLDKPVTTTLEMPSFTAEERTLGSINSYTSTATYTMENIPTDTNVKVDIKPSIKTTDGNTDLTEKFDITIKKGNTLLDLTSGTATDSSIVVDTPAEYIVTVTPKANADGEADNAVLEIAKGNNPQINVILESELSAVPTT